MRHPKRKKTTIKTLFFYPSFPKYRKKILQELERLRDMDVSFVSGSTERAHITPLTTEEFPTLRVLKHLRLGPITLHPDLHRNPTLKNFDAVVMAPATLSLSVWFILIARRIAKRRTYLWGQCGRPGKRGVKRIAQECLNRLATGLMVYGEMEKRSACELGTPTSKVSVVRNAGPYKAHIEGLSSSAFRELAAKRGVGVPQTGTINLLYVGRLVASKRLERLVESVGILRNEGVNVTATIVGEGPVLNELQSHAADVELPIAFPGRIYSGRDLQTYFDRATIVVAPNSIGLLAIDALNNGIPVIYPHTSPHNGPEHEALTPGVNSVGLSEPSSEGIADAVKRWLVLAPSLSQRVYEDACRVAVQEWNPRQVAERIANVLTLDANRLST